MTPLGQDIFELAETRTSSILCRVAFPDDLIRFIAFPNSWTLRYSKQVKVDFLV
jgi:hypothetical protein